MKCSKVVKPESDLHLVKPADKSPKPSPQERDSSIAEGMRSYQKVREGLDHELFSGSRDVEKISGLIEQKQLIRSRLAAHGVRVGP